MKPLLKLLQMLSTELENHHLVGVCEVIDSLRITNSEQNKLLAYFKKNRPNYIKHKEFFGRDCFGGSIFWWTMDRAGMYQRRLFIKHLIEQVKKDESLLSRAGYSKR